MSRTEVLVVLFKTGKCMVSMQKMIPWSMNCKLITRTATTNRMVLDGGAVELVML